MELHVNNRFVDVCPAYQILKSNHKEKVMKEGKLIEETCSAFHQGK